MTRRADAVVHGSVAPGFERVRGAFARNFTHRGEIGAACAAYYRGEKVVDLWGGCRDSTTGAPWLRDTLVMVFSATKGMTGLALALAHSRGLIEHDAPVARYWPEFAQQGKARITVRQMLSHQAGLPALDRPFDAATLGDLDAVAAVLAAQRPAWEPGTRHGYHAHSLGWYAGELLRRVDPQHRSLGRFFRDEIATPLGLDFYVGLPAELPPERLARVQRHEPVEALLSLHHVSAPFMLSYLWPGSLTRRTFTNPSLRSPADLDQPAFRAVEMPASNGIGQARALARAYGVLAAGGQELGLRPETLATLTEYPRDPSGGRRDQVLKVDSVFSLGFTRPSSGFRFGSSLRSFGAAGVGGSFGFADPDVGLGYGYVMNRLGFRMCDDPRDRAVREAIYACISDAA